MFKTNKTTVDRFDPDFEGVETFIVHFSDGRPSKTVFTRANAEGYWYGPMPVSKITYANGFFAPM
jgi:hypothetical protein